MALVGGIRKALLSQDRGYSTIVSIVKLVTSFFVCKITKQNLIYDNLNCYFREQTIGLKNLFLYVGCILLNRYKEMLRFWGRNLALN